VIVAHMVLKMIVPLLMIIPCEVLSVIVAHMVLKMIVPLLMIIPCEVLSVIVPYMVAPCGPREYKTRPDPFPGRMW